MVSINYIISTYDGVVHRTHSYPPPQEVLRRHLQQLLEIPHQLTQITIVKIQHTQPQLEGYYEIEDLLARFQIPVVILEYENFGYSNGQLLNVYEKYRDQFDYYLLSEDDYALHLPEGDQIFLQKYQEIFPDNLGNLSCHIRGRPLDNSVHPLHWEGSLFISQESLRKIYEYPLWEGDPRANLDILVRHEKMIQEQDPQTHQFLTRSRGLYLGAYYQVAMSLLCTYSGLPHADILEFPYALGQVDFVYWADALTSKSKKNKKKKKKALENHPSGGTLQRFFKAPRSADAPEIIPNLKIWAHSFHSITLPVQICRTLTLVIGMHRTGTSVLGNCLQEMGMEYGKTHNQDKNAYNVNGYFENQAFTRFHNKVLKTIGWKWNTVGTQSPADQEVIESYAPELVELITREYQESTNHFFLKDPRIVMVWPVYEKALSLLGTLRFNLLCPTREKVAVVKSLKRAQGGRYNYAKLYNQHERFCEKIIAQHPTLVYRYEDLIQSPVEMIQKIADFLGKKVDALQIAQIINPEYQHFK